VKLLETFHHPTLRTLVKVSFHFQRPVEACLWIPLVRPQQQVPYSCVDLVNQCLFPFFLRLRFVESFNHLQMLHACFKIIVHAMTHLILAAANLPLANLPESFPSHETFRTSAQISASEDHRLIFTELENLDAVRDLVREYWLRHSDSRFLLNNENSADDLAFV
jgi:hypothetical protein